MLTPTRLKTSTFLLYCLFEESPEQLALKDFTEKEIENLKRKRLILTTEKDYVRLNGQLEKIIYITVKHTFLFNGQLTLEKVIHEFMK